MTTPPELPQAEATREHLQQARYHLDLARELLDRPTPEYRAAAVHVVACYQRALTAITTWNSLRLPEGTDVPELGRRAAHYSAPLQTSVNRVIESLPILRAVGAKAKLGVNDREGIETGWYTARNLYRIVAGELPASVRAGRDALSAPGTERRVAGRRNEAASARPERMAGNAERSVEHATGL